MEANSAVNALQTEVCFLDIGGRTFIQCSEYYLLSNQETIIIWPGPSALCEENGYLNDKWDIPVRNSVLFPFYFPNSKAFHITGINTGIGIDKYRNKPDHCLPAQNSVHKAFHSTGISPPLCLLWFQISITEHWLYAFHAAKSTLSASPMLSVLTNEHVFGAEKHDGYIFIDRYPDCVRWLLMFWSQISTFPWGTSSSIPSNGQNHGGSQVCHKPYASYQAPSRLAL